MALAHCIYCSVASNPNFSPSDLQSLLEVSRAKNTRLGISGMLLYQDGTFFQVIEGELDIVENLFNTIDGDTRHQKVTKIILEQIPRREFGDWTMGYANATYKELQEIPGLSNFFAEGNSFMELGKSKSKVLLSAFKEGRWRTSLSPKDVVVRH